MRVEMFSRALRLCRMTFVEKRQAAFVLGGVVGGIALGYSFCPAFAAFLAPLRRWQETGGVAAVLACQAFFCGLVPGLLFAASPTTCPRRPILVCLAQAVWFGVLGLACVAFYSVQDRIFGIGTDLGTLAAKTLFDQLVFNPVFLAPLHAAFFFWVARNFSLSRVRAECPHGFYRNLVLPNLLANWIVSIPVVFSAYALPASLRLPVMGFAGTFWSVLCLQLGKKSSETPV